MPHKFSQTLLTLIPLTLVLAACQSGPDRSEQNSDPLASDQSPSWAGPGRFAPPPMDGVHQHFPMPLSARSFMGGPHRPGMDEWRMADANRDGSISLDEYLIPIESRNDRLFLALDRDGDMRITAVELPDPDRRGRPGPARDMDEGLRSCVEASGALASFSGPEPLARTLAARIRESSAGMAFADFVSVIEDEAEARFHRNDSNEDGRLDREEMLVLTRTEREQQMAARRAIRDCLAEAWSGGDQPASP